MREWCFTDGSQIAPVQGRDRKRFITPPKPTDQVCDSSAHYIVNLFQYEFVLQS